VILIALLLLAALATIAQFIHRDRQQVAKLDAFVKSTAPLPTPPPVNREEMDPDKE
jgi:hypothetical protein